MNQDLQNQMFKDFPVIFGDHDKPMTQTAMCWGLDFGPGWLPIVRRLCEKITALGPLECPVVADQVKEKYGGLRFYYHGGPPDKRRWFGLALWPIGLARALYWGVFYGWLGWRHVFHLASRLTYWPYDDPVQDLVNEAEAESYRTCEECGQPGKPNKQGWIMTLCDPCREKLVEIREAQFKKAAEAPGAVNMFGESLEALRKEKTE
jgi:hypothetical protein